MLVVVPLEYSDGLSTNAPLVSDLVDVVWPHGPGTEVPGIYMVPPRILATFEVAEDYRIALGDDGFPTGFVAYYRCWRSHADAARGWEFNRAVYLRGSRTGG